MYRCPKCYAQDNFSISAIQRVVVKVDAAGDVWDSDGDNLEWDDDAPMNCSHCEYSSEVKEFEQDDEA